jgi:uncharacterized protein (TIGR02594 family)
MWLLLAIPALLGIGRYVSKNLSTRKTAFQIAQNEIGVHEIEGHESSDRILEYLKTTNLPAAVLLDSTPWCAAFVNWCLIQAGKPSLNTAWARSFLNYGTPTTTPNRGDIVVFERGDGGHVGFFDSYTPNGNILVLGGNQSDQVKYSEYSKSKLLGFRKIP